MRPCGHSPELALGAMGQGDTGLWSGHTPVCLKLETCSLGSIDPSGTCLDGYVLGQVNYSYLPLPPHGPCSLRSP